MHLIKKAITTPFYYYQDKKENYKRYYERHKARLLTYQMNYNRIKKNQLLIYT